MAWLQSKMHIKPQYNSNILAYWFIVCNNTTVTKLSLACFSHIVRSCCCRNEAKNNPGSVSVFDLAGFSQHPLLFNIFSGSLCFPHLSTLCLTVCITLFLKNSCISLNFQLFFSSLCCVSRPCHTGWESHTSVLNFSNFTVKIRWQLSVFQTLLTWAKSAYLPNNKELLRTFPCLKAKSDKKLYIKYSFHSNRPQAWPSSFAFFFYLTVWSNFFYNIFRSIFAKSSLLAVLIFISPVAFLSEVYVILCEKSSVLWRVPCW